MKKAIVLFAASMAMFATAKTPKDLVLTLGAETPLPAGSKVVMIVSAGQTIINNTAGANGETTYLGISEDELRPKEVAHELAILKAVVDCNGGIPPKTCKFSFPNFDQPSDKKQIPLITLSVTVKITNNDKTIYEERTTIPQMVKTTDERTLFRTMSIYSTTNKAGATSFGVTCHSSDKTFSPRSTVVHGIRK